MNREDVLDEVARGYKSLTDAKEEAKTKGIGKINALKLLMIIFKALIYILTRLDDQTTNKPLHAAEQEKSSEKGS